MTKDLQTLGVYDEKAQDYIKMVQSEGANKHLVAFADMLPPGAKVLDLGCGPGHCSAYLRDQGFAVTATDASPGMAAQAQETYGVTVKVATFDDLTEVDHFDGVLASFSLLHAPKSKMPDHLRAIHRALHKGGAFSIGLKTGEGAARDRLGRYYAYYTDAEISDLLTKAGFTILDRSTGIEAGLDGTPAPWIVLRAHA